MSTQFPQFSAQKPITFSALTQTKFGQKKDTEGPDKNIVSQYDVSEAANEELAQKGDTFKKKFYG